MNLFKHFEKNAEGKDFVVGDLHGCFDLLEEELSKLNFNKETDRLFSVGDLVDRGDQSELSIDYIAYPWFHTVAGNHEIMACEYYEHDIKSRIWNQQNYRYNGGKWFIDLPEDRKKQFADIFRSLPIMIEIETEKSGLVGLLHASCPVNDWYELINMFSSIPENAEDEHSLNILIGNCIWDRKRIYDPDTTIIENIDKIFHGHTPVKEVVILGNRWYIDTGAVFNGNLTILEI